MKCNALDALKIFSGDVTDSDTGSVYMKLDKMPAALLPKNINISTTGPFDPRRRPLIDISNGDYSDLRKHLLQQNISLGRLMTSDGSPDMGSVNPEQLEPSYQQKQFEEQQLQHDMQFQQYQQQHLFQQQCPQYLQQQYLPYCQEEQLPQTKQHQEQSQQCFIAYPQKSLGFL
ncbi:hypothetical protein Anas_03278 [Armadillidium nasatum]|uniref:Uncharacterized protein n=1 Tax=Armadillidium nasatum TaxID=96803 RepID=A0A5N5SPT0_9CRUS|nr:hypothetical protein Anas_03278 [Armadillidium nasatum]